VEKAIGMTAPHGLLVSGSVIHDTLVLPAGDAPWGTTTFVDAIESHPGGNGTNTSMAVAKLGTPVRLLASVGDDAPGRYLLDALRDAGVDTSCVSVVPGAPTAATIALVNRLGDRKFFHRMGVSLCAFAEPVDFSPRLIAGISHYHLASLFILPKLRAHAPETLARARAAGLTTSLDTNWDPQGRWSEDLRGCLPHLDFIFLNEDEARMVTGSKQPRQSAKCLLEGGVGTVVLKLGPGGCLIASRDSEIALPAFAVEARDTTGAGDCFVGGFLAALARGATLAEAGLWGNAMGAITVQHLGGASGIPDDLDLAAWMAAAEVRHA
jgi:sugar/nucleoside kinase (ribokinase family)